MVSPSTAPGTAERSLYLKDLIAPDHMRAVPLTPRDNNTGMPSWKLKPTFDSKDDQFYLANQPKKRLPLSKQPAFTSPGNRAPATATGKSKKRKIAADEPDVKAIMFPDDALEVDEDDPRLQILDKGYTCQMVRKKIRAWLDSGAQKVGEFQKEVGISSPSYSNFMNRQGTWDGDQCDLYLLAAMFFRKRELQGLPLAVPKSKAKKTKTDDGADGGKAGEADGKKVGGTSGKKAGKGKDDGVLDVSGVEELPGESNMAVDVFDTCNEMRKKIRSLQTKGVTQAAICRAFSSSFPEGSGKSVSATNLRTFMSNKGVMGGNTSSAFYGGYVFLEKKRLKEGKPKSKFREEMESVHKTGVNVERNMNGPMFVHVNDRVSIDKYGKLHFTRG